MKKTLRLALALVLALVMVFALTACEQHECESKCEVCGKCMDAECTEKVCAEKCEGHQTSPNVPTEEGKFTWFLTLSEESLEIPAHASIFVTGGATNWATGVDAIELRPLEGTNVWYAISDYDPEDTPEGIVAQKFEYGAVLGYNAASGLGADAQGLKWIDSFKSNECLAYAYPANATFTVDGNKIDLGTHTFATVPGAPVVLEKVTFELTLTEALPEGWVVVMPGSHAEWAKSDKTIMTPSADRKTWTLTVENILEGTYEYKLLAVKADAAELNWANLTVGAGEQNEQTSISGMDENGVVPLRGEPASFDAAIFVNPVATNSTITVTFSAPIAEGVTVCIPGGFNGQDIGAAMTPNADRTVWSFAVESVENGTEFKVVVFAEGVTPAWNAGTEFCAEGGANAKISCEAGDGLTIAAFAEPLVYPVPDAE